MPNTGFVDPSALLLDALPQPVWCADERGRLICANERWTEYTGLALEESLGTGWAAALHPDDRDDAVRAWEVAVGEQREAEFRLRIRRFDDVYRWFIVRAVPVRDERGAVVRWLGANSDIEDEVQTERLLAASEARYRSIIELSQEGVWIVDATGRTRYVNGRMAEMLGSTPDEMFGTLVFEYQHETDRAEAERRFADAATGAAGRGELRFRRRDGTDLWALVSTTPLFEDDGVFNGMLAMVGDITERKAMETRLATAAAEYQSLAEATPQIVWTADASGAIEYLNGRWTEYTGIVRDDARGWGWVPAVHKDDLAAVLATWRTAVDTAREMDTAYRLRRARDSAYRWHVMRARPLRGPDGRVQRWFGTLTDIHEERRTAHQLDVIARTSSLLAESFDRDALLDRLAVLIATELARFVTIDLFDDDGRLITVATAHRDPAVAGALRGLHGRRCRVSEQESSIAALSAGQAYRGTLLASELEAAVHRDVRDIVRAAGAGSYVCAPMAARGRTTGAITAFAPADAPFTDDDVLLFTEIAARAAVAVENTRLYAREHRVSATLQQALLPTRLPEIAGVTFDAIYQPGATEAQIGGDWYDAAQLADGRVLVSIGDVTGRGLRAAVIMGRVRQAIETLATYQSDPCQLLNAADAVLRRAHPDAIVTALVGVIDRQRRTFAYATAGHPTPLVRSPDGSIVTLPGYGLPLGLRDAHQPPTSTIVLPPNALLLLYTDGLVESTRDIDEGERRLFAALADDAVAGSSRPAAEIARTVLHDGSSDDVAVFAVRVADGASVPGDTVHDALRGEWSMRWSFDARDARSARDVRDIFIAYLRAKGAHDADYSAAELVFGELIGNVVRHAPGVVEVEIEWRGAAPVLHVLDRGPGYDRSESLPSTLTESGRGLYLVAQLTRDFTVTRLPGYGSHARAVLPIDRST